MHGVIRKKFPKFVAKLSRQSFVMSDDKRRLLDFLNDICDRKSFARARNAKQSLISRAAIQADGQFFNRLRLIPSWFEF